MGYFIQILLKFVPKGPINNRPLSESMTAKFTDTYICQWAMTSQLDLIDYVVYPLGCVHICFGWQWNHVIVMYCQNSNIRCSKSRNVNVSHLILQLSLPNPLKPGVSQE